MGVFLQAVGGFVVLILLLVLLVVGGSVLYLRFQLGKMKRLAKMMGGPVAPVRIHLEARARPEWRDSKAAREVEAFVALGYVPTGPYHLREVPEVWMQPFVNPDESAFGLVTEHPAAGVWSEIVQFQADGTVLTVSSIKDPNVPNSPPYKQTIRLTGASPADLHATFVEHAGSPIRPHTPSAFASDFEEAYHRDMAWNYREGPLKGMEAQQIADMIQMPIDEETAEFLGTKDESIDLDGEIIKRFLATSCLTAAEWEEVRDDIVLVHDGKDWEEIEWVCEERLELEIWDFEIQYEATETRARFRELLEKSEVGESFRLLGEVDAPVVCDVYQQVRVPA